MPSRRKFLAISTAGITVGVAGCTSDDSTPTEEPNAGNGGSSGNGGSTSTPELSELDGDEWRERVSEKAAEEDGALKLNLTERTDDWITLIEEREYEGPYAPLTGNVDFVDTGADKQANTYQQQLAADSMRMGILDAPQIHTLQEQGSEFMDLTDIPSFQDAPDGVKVPPYAGVENLSVYGQIYNTNTVSDPPSSFDDYLSSRFDGARTSIDYTPTPPAAAALLMTVGGEEAGREYLRNLKDHLDIAWDSSLVTVTQMPGDGRADLGLNVEGDIVERNKARGLDLEWVDSAETTFLLPTRLSIAQGTPTPWKAKLWMDWVMRPENSRKTVDAMPGKVSIDRSFANPEQLGDLSAVQEAEIWSRADLDISPTDAVNIWQEELDAPSA